MQDDAAGEAEETGGGAELGYAGRLKTAVLDCVDTARRAPETFEEALAVMKGERAVKPDYGRAVSTVSAVRFFKTGLIFFESGVGCKPHHA